MTLLNLHHQRTQAQDAFIPTVPLDASTTRLYNLPNQHPRRQRSVSGRRPRKTWLRHFLHGLL